MSGVSRSRMHIAARICTFFVALALYLAPSAVSAQVVNQYTNSTSGAIADSPTCASTVTRTFTVGTSFNVSDVNIGIQLTHSYRSDLRATLTSPTGTTVQLMSNVGGAADNLSVLFDDSAPASIGGHMTDDSSTTVPPYQRTFRPDNALSAFNGQAAQGTWELSICDTVNVDTGNFIRADLYLARTAATYSDLSLRFTYAPTNPSSGSNVTYTLTIANAAAPSVTAGATTVRFPLPAGVTFVSASGQGSYNSATGIWSLSQVIQNSTVVINITANVTAAAGSTILASAEIISTNNPDIDSFPNNNSTEEDDDAFASFFVGGGRTAGIAPSLFCPAGSTLFDWDQVVWTAGSTDNSYSVPNLGTVNFRMSLTPLAAYSSAAIYGGPSPARQTTITGGLLPAQNSLVLFMDNTARDAAVTTTLSLPTAVPGVQFRIFDVDLFVNADPLIGNDFADRVTVTGLLNGVPVNPTLTNGISNYVIGNSAYADATAANETANGDVVVTFSGPVDTIIIVYNNHALSQLNPFQQAISIHDITLCRPQANLTVSKASNIIGDGVSASNPKALPDALVNYCVVVNNTGISTATNVSITDPLPATLSYVPGTLSSGPSCSMVKTAEDDDSVGSDESDLIGASVTNNVITATATSMSANSSFAISFQAIIK